MCDTRFVGSSQRRCFRWMRCWRSPPLTAMSSPIDARVLLATAVFCAVAAFLFGLAPAFRLTTRRALGPGQTAAVRPSRMLDLFSGFQVALTLPLVTRGRLLDEHDNRKGAASVAVITEAMARATWPGEDAIGKCFYLGRRD